MQITSIAFIGQRDSHCPENYKRTSLYQIKPKKYCRTISIGPIHSLLQLYTKRQQLHRNALSNLKIAFET